MDQMYFEDSYFTYEANILRVGNAKIERTWDLSSKSPISVSLRNKAQDDEWLDHERNLPMVGSSLTPFSEHPTYQVSGNIDNCLGISKQHLKVIVEVFYQKSQLKLEIYIFPNNPVLKTDVWLKRTAEGESFQVEALDAEVSLDDNSLLEREKVNVDFFDCFSLRDLHCSWKNVAFLDVTDHNNNLVEETSGLLYRNERRVIAGNLLVLNKTLKDSGLFLLKEGPTPLAYLNESSGDFEFRGKDIFLIGSGISENDLLQENYVKTYSCAVGVWQGDEVGMTNALHQYYQSSYVYDEKRDYFVMANTWGDRSKDGRISEEFILKELPVAARLGISIYQIDDGWQTGVTSNSVKPGGKWSDYYQDNDDFWSVNSERFPNGLEPIVELAAEKNIQLGLWFSPDSANHFANWEKDAIQLIKLYETYGVKYFKLDGVNFQSKTAEMNFTKLLEKVLQTTTREVYFNLDTTAQVRSGYFAKTMFGTIFLENRYTDFQSYYPHWTLRNVWNLAKYIPAQKLQMEFLNVDRNKDKYGDDPLSPANVGIAYAFAVTMFSNPLAWMEVTGLSEQNEEILSKVIKAYRTYQNDILSGHILPVGAEPNGVSWTGLQSLKNESEGYLLLFREFNNREHGEFRLWNDCGDAVKLEVLLEKEGSNEIQTREDSFVCRRNANGTFTFSADEPFSFKLLKYSFE